MIKRCNYELVKAHKFAGYLIFLTILFIILGCDSAQKHIEIAERHYNNRELDNALNELNTASKLEPKNYHIYFLRGMVQLEKKNSELAFSDFQAGCADGPSKNGDKDACNMYLSMRTGTDIQGMINRSLPR